MDSVIELGVNDNDIKIMLELCPGIIGVSNYEIENLINILRYVGCNDSQIRNIIVTNPFYLERSYDDILKLIQYLKKFGVNNLDIIFDMNPYLLNKDDFEIEEYLNNRIRNGNKTEDIISEFENNPYIIDEN